VLFTCATCAGLWVDAQTLSRIKDRPTDFAPLLQVPSAAAVPLDKVRYLRCPRCQQIMNRIAFGQRTGVILDHCNEHGTWFDADELGRVVDYLMKHGPEPARARLDESLEARRRTSQSNDPPHLLLRPIDIPPDTNLDLLEWLLDLF
jgi:Zn-finger nucleic acid-binding protein